MTDREELKQLLNDIRVNKSNDKQITLTKKQRVLDKFDKVEQENTNILDTLKKGGLVHEEIDILEKEDIKEILHFKDDATALRFLRVSVKHGYGMKIGKSYKITRKNFEKMLRFLEGQEFDF